MLAMPSNLLAHHLRVLEGTGLIARTRSEGDKRRSYVRLVPAILEDVHPSIRRTAPRVLFVCTANSARSHLAAALWRRSSTVPAVSAGRRPAPRIDPAAIAAAHRHQLPLRRVRPRRVDEVHAAGDLVITVCDLAHEELAELGDIHWSVADPVLVGTAVAFDHAVDELSRRVSNLAPHLAAS
jgi:protein-tyrosine-phosphatase